MSKLSSASTAPEAARGGASGESLTLTFGPLSGRLSTPSAAATAAPSTCSPAAPEGGEGGGQWGCGRCQEALPPTARGVNCGMRRLGGGGGGSGGGSGGSSSSCGVPRFPLFPPSSHSGVPRIIFLPFFPVFSLVVPRFPLSHLLSVVVEQCGRSCSGAVEVRFAPRGGLVQAGIRMLE